MRKIILADNQQLARAGWLYLINRAGISLPVEEAENKKEIVAGCMQQNDPLIVLDYNLFDFEGVNDVIILSSRFPKSAWIICCDSLSEEFIRKVVFESSNISILLKDSPAEDLQSALKQALKGERYISSYISNILFESSKSRKTEQKDHVLTQTEKEILREMALGKSTREIAELRHASIHTITTHRKNIFRKIGVNNVYEATKYAIRAGLIDMADYYI
jgi:two-component system, NarL family, response regulator LiaR